MGATCAKGSKTTDPDKTPYGQSAARGSSKGGSGRRKEKGATGTIAPGVDQGGREAESGVPQVLETEPRASGGKQGPSVGEQDERSPTDKESKQHLKLASPSTFQKKRSVNNGDTSRNSIPPEADEQPLVQQLREPSTTAAPKPPVSVNEPSEAVAMATAKALENNKKESLLAIGQENGQQNLFSAPVCKTPVTRESDQKTSKYVEPVISATTVGDCKANESETKPRDIFGKKHISASVSPTLVGFSAIQQSDVKLSVKSTESASYSSTTVFANSVDVKINSESPGDIEKNGKNIVEKDQTVPVHVSCDVKKPHVDVKFTSDAKQNDTTTSEIFSGTQIVSQRPSYSDKPSGNSPGLKTSSITGSEAYFKNGNIEVKTETSVLQKSGLNFSADLNSPSKPGAVENINAPRISSQNGIASHTNGAADSSSHGKSLPQGETVKPVQASPLPTPVIFPPKLSDASTPEKTASKPIQSVDARDAFSTGKVIDEKSSALIAPCSPTKLPAPSSVMPSAAIRHTTTSRTERVSQLSPTEPSLQSAQAPTSPADTPSSRTCNVNSTADSNAKTVGSLELSTGAFTNVVAAEQEREREEVAKEIVVSPPDVIPKEQQSPPIQPETSGTKRDRVSRLPTSRLPSASSTSPVVLTSVSSPTSVPSLSPTSPTGSSAASPQQKLSLGVASTQHEEEIPREELASLVMPMLIDLAEENKAVLDLNVLCPNTRAKLLQAVERSMSGKDRENPSRVLTIHGKSGIGKTCFSGEVCRKFSAELIGCHFFQYHPVYPDQNYAVTMLLSLADQLCRNFPEYLEALPRPSKLEKIIGNADVSEMFDAFITQPLQSPIIHQDLNKHRIIVIDDLSECDLSQRDQLIQLINNFNEKTPDWLHLLVTLNDEAQLLNQLSTVQLIELKGTSEAMTADLKRYFKDPMSPFIDRISLDGAQAQLMQNSQGSFLCAYLLRKRLESLPAGTKLALRDVAMYPSGLTDIYKEAFQRLFDFLSKKISIKEASGVYNSVVGLLVVAQEPIDKAAFSQIHSGLDVDETLSQLGACVCIRDDTFVGFYHKNTCNWLQSAEEAPAKLMPNIAEARKKMAELCMKWLENVLGTPATSVVSDGLKNYALRHALTHLTDVPSEQDNIATILCSLYYVENKLKLPRVNINTLFRDFKHSHYQFNSVGAKLVTLANYMKKFPNLVEQIQVVHRFVVQHGKQLEARPEFTLHIAANYRMNERIQQNAKIDVAEKPWLEDLTATADTPCTTKDFDGTICDVDGSPDNKSVVLLTMNKDSSLMLHILNAANGESIIEPINLKNISERNGTCVKVLADNTNVFVSSLVSYLNMKTGKSVPCGLDVGSIPIKERFTIECCDATANLLCCGVTTLPWGGRTLHLIVFDLKTKKCTKVLEVLKFKFGGSAQFGVKACSLSADGSLLCVCVKQTNKCELRVTTWSTVSWEILQSKDVSNDAVTKCSFIGNEYLALSGSVRNNELAQGKAMKNYLWSFHEKSSEVGLMNKLDRSSIAWARGSQFVTAQWFQLHGIATLSKWKNFSAVSQSPDDLMRVHGIDEAADMLAFDKTLVVIANNSAKFYRLADLEKIPTVKKEDIFPVGDAELLGVSFLPRSDEPIVTYRGVRCSDHDLISTCSLNLKGDGLLISKHLFTDIKQSKLNANTIFGRKRFRDSFSEICGTSPDGSLAILRNGNNVIVSEVNGGKTKLLPLPDKLQALSETDSLICAVSPKDSIVGVVYSTAPNLIFLHDIKAKPGASPVQIQPKENNAQSCVVKDIDFLPSTGDVIVYTQRSVFVWNPKTGALVSEETDVDITYVKSSPTSDRLAVSIHSDVTKCLVLRNAANNINCPLKLAPGTTWLPDLGKSSVQFSDDGTVVIGVCSGGNVSRVWNAANGEVLMDLNLKMTGGDVEIVGMLTNTHAVFTDRMWLVVCDIGNGDVTTALPLDDIPNQSSETLSQNSKRPARNSDAACLQISPRGNFIVGAARDGALRVYRSQNIEGVKRKTTLQRMKAK